MKVYYRSSVIYNTIQLVIMSAASLYIVSNIIAQNNLFAYKTLLSSLSEFKIYLAVTFVTIISLIRLKKESLYFFVIQGILFCFYNGEILWSNFNKLTLVFLSVFLTLYFYFYFLLRDDLASAYIRPYFLKNYVGGRPRLEIDVLVRSSSQQIKGHLANWDDMGCYVYLEEPLSVTVKEVWIDFPFENRTFQDRGIIATLSKDKSGLGVYIKMKNDLSSEKKFKWKSFIKILQDRGLTPSRIK